MLRKVLEYHRTKNPAGKSWVNLVCGSVECTAMRLYGWLLPLSDVLKAQSHKIFKLWYFSLTIFLSRPLIQTLKYFHKLQQIRRDTRNFISLQTLLSQDLAVLLTPLCQNSAKP
jgi:hypothetical protein